jgi:hypothetical protein
VNELLKQACIFSLRKLNDYLYRTGVTDDDKLVARLNQMKIPLLDRRNKLFF